MESLASTTKDLSVDEMIALVLKAGEVAVTTMATLDEANTSTYGQPELTEVNLGVGTNPGIPISGHDLKDMEELLRRIVDCISLIYYVDDIAVVINLIRFIPFCIFIFNWKQPRSNGIYL